jgi:ribonuclease G
VALEGLRKMREIAADDKVNEAFLIRVNPKVAALLNHPDSGLVELEEETGKRFHFEGGEALSMSNFELIESGDRKSIEERALPFRPEEEVLVTIEEPHMYNADDAIARIDSYIISVTGAADWVGERRMVKIESVERASAVASLLPDSEQPERSQPKKTPSSNGRGGNRNRSRNRRPAAKAAAVAESADKDDPEGAGPAGSGGDGSGNGTASPEVPETDTGTEGAPVASAPEPVEKAPSAAENGAGEPEGDKSVNSRRFGLRRGRRRRGRGPDSNAGS